MKSPSSPTQHSTTPSLQSPPPAPSFAAVLQDWPAERVRKLIESRTRQDVERALRQAGFSPERLAAFLSPAAPEFLETMAQQSAVLTRRRFGKAMQFYAPLYVSSHCINSCVYCGFNRHNDIPRCALPIEDAVKEARVLAEQGFQHLLLVSGEDPKGAPVDYFEQLVSRLHGMFSSISIEIYPLSTEDYARLVKAGVDSLTLYQETYLPDPYKQFHPAGPKRDFAARLDAIERGAKGGITFLGIGALLGLCDWRLEAFYVGLHARYLQQTYWRQHVSVSFPRMREAAGGFQPLFPVSDAAFVQILCALRLLLPDAGMVLSTRESAELRDHMIPLGITRVSAGSVTTPGGYAEATQAEEQFEVQDQRSLPEVMAAVAAMGFDPVRKDWDVSYH